MIAALAFLLVPLSCAVWEKTRTHPTPVAVSNGYEPRVGDVLFQSLPHHELIDAIEGSTRSPYSHCGIVALDRGRWMVIEAIGPVRQTPLEQWIRQGRGGTMAAHRLHDRYGEKLDAFIAAARTHLGKPYDTRYRLDDERIYCSELIYKAFKDATGEDMGQLVRLGDLDWKPYESTIRKYEGGEPPLDRLMITPRDLAKAPQLNPVFPK